MVRRNTLQVQDVPSPTSTDELVVRLDYASVNPVDQQVADGQLGRTDDSPALTLGCEGVGTVDGRRVLVSGAGLGVARDGTYAELVVAPSSALYDVPPGASSQQAAAAGVAGSTAWIALHDFGAVSQTSTVLVLGASGGVGTLAVQLARLAGSTVIAQTGHTGKAAFLERLGATVVVAPDAQSLVTAQIPAPDVVIDPLGGSFTAACVLLAQPRARIVLFGAASGATSELNVQTMYRKGVSIVTFSGGTIGTEQRRHSVEEVLSLIAGGSLRVPIHAVLPLAAAQQAHTMLSDRAVTGKVLLDPTA
jgi:NADPH:quinone reductase